MVIRTEIKTAVSVTHIAVLFGERGLFRRRSAIARTAPRVAAGTSGGQTLSL
jgi:hypothetical protein